MTPDYMDVKDTQIAIATLLVPSRAHAENKIESRSEPPEQYTRVCYTINSTMPVVFDGFLVMADVSIL